MATIKTTIKRRNGTGWDELRPKTEVDQITDFDANVPDNLDDLTNVNAPSPSDGQALVWDNATSKWVPGTVAVDVSGKLSKYTWQPGIVYWHNGGTDAGFRNILKVTSSSLSTGGILYVDGTSGSVVVNARFEILVNHYQDIVVKSLSSGYTQVKIKVQSSTNDEFNLLIARDRNDTNTTTITATFIPYDQNATVTTYTNNPAVSYSSVTLTHTTIAFSENISATGGSTGKLYVEGSQVWHAGNDGASSGLDADTLDTKHASDFVAVTGDTMTGNLNLQSSSLKLYSYQNTADAYRYIGTEYSSGNGNNKAEIRFAIDGADTKTRMQFHTANGVGNIDERMRITSSGNVGIGTTSPARKLDVAGDMAITSTFPRIFLIDTDDNSDFSIINANGYFSVYDDTNGAYRFRIDSSGNVGIGTSTPGSKLHILAADPILTIQDTETAGASSDARLRLAESGASNVIDQYWDIKKEGHNFKLQNKYGTTVYDRFTIDGSNGKVGIGITSPGSRLDVLANAKITSASNSTHSLKLEARNEYLNDTGSSGIFVTAGGTSTVSDFSSQGAHLVLETRQSSRNIYFKAGNTTSAQHIMDYNGNVGIGTTSPASPLHTYKNTSSGSNVISLETLNNKWDFRIGNSGEFLIRDGSYDRLTINNSNGNATFANDLTVQGDLFVSGSFTTIDTDTTTTEQWSVTNDGTGPAVIINQKGSQPVIDIQDDGTSVFHIEDGGNVGIGTTNPTRKLHINSGTNDIGLLVESSDQFAKIGLKDNTTTSDAQVLIAAVGNDMFLEAGGSEKVRIKSGGNVGIGTTSPIHKLQVGEIGTTTTLGTMAVSSDANGYAILIEEPSQGAESWGIGVDTAGDLNFYDSGSSTPSVVFNDGGNVGIGTTSPGEKLEVNGNINANELHINDTNTIVKEGSGNSVRMQTNSGYIDIGPNNTGWGHIQTDRGRFYFNKGADFDGDVRMYDNNTTKMENSTGYIYELGNRVLTTASDVLQSYEFSPGSSNGSRRFVRLFTLNGFNNSSGAFADVILSGSGDYGDFDRTALRIMAGERGNAVTVDVYSLNSEDTSDAPIIYYKSTGTANSFEIWAQLADYNYQHRLSVLAKQGGFTVNLDSITTTTPSGLNTVTQKTLWHSGNGGTGSGLDADTLDTYQASQFLRSDTNDTYQGTLTLHNTSDVRLPNSSSKGISTSDGYRVINSLDSVLRIGDTGKHNIVRLHGQGSDDFKVYYNSTDYEIYHEGNLDGQIPVYDGVFSGQALNDKDEDVMWSTGYSSGGSGAPTNWVTVFNVPGPGAIRGFQVASYFGNSNEFYMRSQYDGASGSWNSWERLFTEAYHPNADKLTTARTIAGVSFDGTANISLNNNAITNGAGYTTNTGTVTNVTGGTGVDVTNGTTTPSITLDLSEFTSMTDDINGLADELILLDGGAERRKTISSIKLSQFNNDAGWSSRRPVTAGGNSLASSESLDFIAGTGITISESGGDVTISASSSGEPEWEYVTKVSGANPLTYSGMDALSNYEYKFVVEVVTTAEDNSNPYIRINNDSTTGETSYQYTRVQQTTLTSETETHNGNANSNLIYTGLALSSYSNGGTSVSTVHNAEFIYTISPYSSSPGIYTGIVDGWGSTHYSSQSGTAYDGMVQSRFTGRKRSIYQTEANRIDYYHDITAGTTDYSEMRVYRRPKK